MTEDRLELELDLREVIDVPILPPRRRFWDFVPARIVGALRKRYKRPGPTRREIWTVKALALRVILMQVVEELEKVPATKDPLDYYLHATKKDTPQGDLN